MFKNTVEIKITNKDSFMMINRVLSRELRDQFYILLQEYVPQFVRQIIPDESGYKYDITWVSKDEFNRFTSDDRYIRTLQELTRFSAYVNWIEDQETNIVR
jgi:hypothetical protein